MNEFGNYFFSVFITRQFRTRKNAHPQSDLIHRQHGLRCQPADYGLFREDASILRPRTHGVEGIKIFYRVAFRLVEAGYDLYATRFQVLRRIIIPLVKPGIIAGSILVFIPSLGAYVTPRVLGGGKQMMLGNLIDCLLYTSPSPRDS